MHFEGTFSVSATRETLFAFLMDPNQVSPCVPGLRKLDVKSPQEYIAIVRAGVSFIQGDFTMHCTVAEVTPLTKATFISHGTGIGSSVDLETTMELSDSSDGGTLMKWQAVQPPPFSPKKPGKSPRCFQRWQVPHNFR